MTKYSNKYTLKSALDAHQKGEIRRWIMGYLKGEGNNAKLASVLESEPDVVYQLVEADLSTLVRIMGPEPGMLFSEDVAKWNTRLANFQKLIKDGFRPTPIFVTDLWGDDHIADGAHRLEALKNCGFTKYWTIYGRKSQSRS